MNRITDYYPFGMPMPNRTYSLSSVSYPFGFNSQLRDDEVYGKGNLNSAEFWEYDTRIGRRWNVDPVPRTWESPYATFSNNPIYFSDINGDLPGPTVGCEEIQANDDCTPEPEPDKVIKLNQVNTKRPRKQEPIKEAPKGGFWKGVGNFFSGIWQGVKSAGKSLVGFFGNIRFDGGIHISRKENGGDVDVATRKGTSNIEIDQDVLSDAFGAVNAVLSGANISGENKGLCPEGIEDAGVAASGAASDISNNELTKPVLKKVEAEYIEMTKRKDTDYIHLRKDGSVSGTTLWDSPFDTSSKPVKKIIRDKN